MTPLDEITAEHHDSKPLEAERSQPGDDAITAAKMALYNASSLLRALTGPDDAVAQSSLKECREALEALDRATAKGQQP